MEQKRYKMVLKTIFGTDIQVSALGLGTVKLGRNQGLKYPKSFELPSDLEVETLLALAEELGINYLDTAPAYGHSEERIGKLLLGNRDNWVIGTKVGEHFENGESVFDFSPKGVKKSLESSLQKLRTDYLDIVFIHSNGADVKILKETSVLDILKEYKEKGILKAIGISSKTVEGGELALDLGCDAVMLMHHPSYPDELPVIEKAAKMNRSIFVKKALSSGHLAKLGTANPIEKSLRFIFEKEAVKSVVVGTINPEHLRENVKIANEFFE